MKRAALALLFAIVAAPAPAADIEDYVGKWEGVGEGSIGADIRRGRAKPEWLVIALDVGAPGCGGSVQVFGQVGGDGRVRAESNETDDAIGEICHIELELVGRRALRIDEGSGCIWAHGASCGFSGNLTPVGR